MSDHPPMPPGCEEWEQHFRIVKDALRINLITSFYDAEARRVDVTRASLYRTKWLDEAERIIEVRKHLPNGEPYDYCRKSRALKDEAYAARDNAEAWRKNKGTPSE